MRILLVYYSRTNTTMNISKKISARLDCDIEEIKDLKKRSGNLNYIKSAYDAFRNKETKIKTMKNDPSNYDLVIIGTPVWASSMATPVLTYLNKNKNKIKELGIITTFKARGDEKTIKNIEKLFGKKSIVSLSISKKNKNPSLLLNHKIDEFVNEIIRKKHAL